MNTPENVPFIESNGLRFFTPNMEEALRNYGANPKLLEPYETDPSVTLILVREISACIKHYENRLFADYLGFLTLKLQNRIRDDVAIGHIEDALVYNDSSPYLWLADSVFRNRAGDSSRAEQSLRMASSLDSALVAELTGQKTR
jgi:hypothetical protein